MECHGLFIPLMSMVQYRSCLFCLFQLIASSPNKLVMMYGEHRDPANKNIMSDQNWKGKSLAVGGGRNYLLQKVLLVSFRMH